MQLTLLVALGRSNARAQVSVLGLELVEPVDGLVERPNEAVEALSDL